jgi:hypothetical protein
MATRKPKQAKPEATPAAPSLLEALRFVKLAQTDTGPPVYRHCVLHDRHVYGFDGVLSAGHPILEDLTLAPQTAKLIQALERVDEQVAMVALPSGLSVRAGRFRAVVPCFPLADMPPIAPDPPITAIDDRLRAGFAAVGPLATESAPQVIQAAVRLSAGTVCATNRHVLVEYWHGIDLPTVLLPKQALKAIESVKRPLAQFGYSPTSATFYFADGSWIKTQLYNEKYPDISRVLDRESSQRPVTPGLFDALRTIRPFANDNKAAIFSLNRLHTAVAADGEGGSYELPGIPEGRCFNIDHLLLLEGLAKTVDYGDGPKGEWSALMFFGDNVRGAVAAMTVLDGRPI